MDINPDINPEDDRAPTKKKKKRGKPKISLKGKGGKKKRHRSGATAEARPGTSGIFPAASNAASSTSLSVGVGGDIVAGPTTSKKEKHQRRERSHRDKERRSASKLAKTEEKVQSLVGVVSNHEQREKDQAHLDKTRDAREEALLASEEKSKIALKQRIDRFDSLRKKKDVETKLQKTKLKDKIAAVRKEKEAMVEKVNKKARDNAAALKKKGEESLSKTMEEVCQKTSTITTLQT